MKKTIITLASAVAITVMTSSYASDNATKKWGYEGATGPEHWGELGAENVMCGIGKSQSPVDISPNTTLDANLPPITMDYTMLVGDRIKNNGHTVQVDIRSGGLINVDGQEFVLKQFHFHTPSENTVQGKNFPLEAHFVHQNEAGELAVVAMMFVPGNPDRTLSELWKNMPTKAGDSQRLSSGALKTIEAEMKVDNYYRFNGSLTTPPCSEGVRWIVLKHPMTVSQEQVTALQEVLGHPNNRPVQKLNARFIAE